MKADKHINKIKQARRVIMTTFILAALLITVLVFVVSYFYGFELVDQHVNSAKPLFAIWRAFLFIVIITGWNKWVSWLSAWAELGDEVKQFYLEYRWRFAVWLLIFEILIVQNILADFIN